MKIVFGKDFFCGYNRSSFELFKRQTTDINAIIMSRDCLSTDFEPCFYDEPSNVTVSSFAFGIKNPGTWPAYRDLNNFRELLSVKQVA